ncbi:beta-N-acetylhexosaminidase [Agromyces sp. NPDC057865]|uniref:beta-N-acetylhexosaminidase n=1 Tax=Agromyces sp. NPDC057865 TaxID=3346267 RepID=UPI0036731F4F
MQRRTAWTITAVAAATGAVIAAGALVGASWATVPAPPDIAVVPQPVQISGVRGDDYTLESGTRIVVDAEDPAAAGTAELLAAMLRPASGFEIPVVSGEEPRTADISLVIADDEAPEGHADEGYTLRVEREGVRIGASASGGLWNGVQTLRQLLPAAIESGQPLGDAIEVVAVEITDYPRFAYRSAMLDVARHFMSIEEVERYIDDISMLKINTLHLHLANDQGWRIEIEGWPLLTEVGGQFEVDAGPGGYYTQEEFRGIVDYAAARNVMIVPEANMPGHTHAALTAYGELTCDGEAPQPHTLAAGGGSSLCPTSLAAEQMAVDVVTQLAALAPGPYVHFGGDEVSGYTDDEYIYFMGLTTQAVVDAGKIPIGWQELGVSDSLPEGTIGQYWGYTEPNESGIELVHSFLDQGGRIIMSPPDVAYVDQVYPDDAYLGLDWAPVHDVEESYTWDPADIFDGVGDDQILGIEAPLWTETVTSIEDAEYLAFPRLGALAEVAWSPEPEDGAGRDFEEFAPRLVSFLQHFEVLGVNFHRSSDLPW